MEQLINLKNLNSLLNSRGFYSKYYDFLDYELIGIDYYDEHERHIQVETYYTKEYEEYLKTLKDGEEYEPDYTKMNVRAVSFEGCVKYPDNNERDGICYLTISSYNKTFPEYFERAYYVFMNPELAAIELQVKHAEYTKKFIQKCKPVLTKYDFISSYDSYWDAHEYALRANSCPMFEYEFNSLYAPLFYTDLVTEKFMMNKNEVDFDNFEEQLINEFMKFENGDIVSDFEYLFSDDPTFTKESASEIYTLMAKIALLKSGKKDHRREVDFNFIPEKYKHLINDYNKLKNE